MRLFSTFFPAYGWHFLSSSSCFFIFRALSPFCSINNIIVLDIVDIYSIQNSRLTSSVARGKEEADPWR